jgi:hypothetical protein
MKKLFSLSSGSVRCIVMQLTRDETMEVLNQHCPHILKVLKAEKKRKAGKKCLFTEGQLTWKYMNV